MQVSDFHFELPDELIARYPKAERTSSRLLCLDGTNGELQHRQFADVLQLVEAGDLLVFNNTRVIPARMFGRKSSGGKLEVLVERVLSEKSCLAHVRASKAPQAGSQLILGEDKLGEGNGIPMLMKARHDTLFELEVVGDMPLLEILQQIGHIPLPPYIDRPDEEADKERYQTVYNKIPGAVAAPTAGLHFTPELLERIRQKGIDIVPVLLHVGLGTFRPVKEDDVADHHMHSEYYEVTPEQAEAINAARARGGRIVCVGTTSVRTLETVATEDGVVHPGSGFTQIFITPGVKIKAVDALITNFHLPQSTLLMLISALMGRENALDVYRQAVEERYRFFSFGDAMMITGKPQKDI